MTDKPAKKRNGERGPGKINAAARENFLAVFVRLGGTAAMAKWAAENLSEFYRLYARLIPIQGPGDNGEHLIQVTWSDES